MSVSTTLGLVLVIAFNCVIYAAVGARLGLYLWPLLFFVGFLGAQLHTYGVHRKWWRP